MNENNKHDDSNGRPKFRLSSRSLWVAIAWIAIMILALFTSTAANAATNLLVAQADDAEVATESEPVTTDIPEESAENSDLPKITLEESIERALSDNRSLELARQAVDMARAGGRSSLAGFLPDLSFFYNYTRLLDTTTIDIPEGGEFAIGNLNTFRLGLSFTYPLYSGGQDRANARAAEADETASELRVEQAETLIISAIVTVYSYVLESGQELEASLASQRHLDEVLHSAQAKFDQGLIPLNDLLAVQVAQAAARQAVLQSERNLELAQSALANLIGADIGDRWELEPIEYPLTEFPFSMETLWEWALSERPELREFEYRRDALEAQMDAVRSSRRPRVNFQADVSRAGDKPDGSSSGGGGTDLSSGAVVQGMISVYWDLYDFGRADDLTAPLEEQLTMLELQEADLREQVKQEVESALLNVRNQYELTGVMEVALVQAAEAFRVAQRRHEEGLGLMLEVLDAEASLLDTNAGEVHTRYEYYRGLAALAASVGMSIDDLVALVTATGEETELP